MRGAAGQPIVIDRQATKSQAMAAIFANPKGASPPGANGNGASGLPRYS
jgi:hypothetical protein